MDIVKRNLVSIICGAVALLAVVFTFFPMGGYFTDLKGKLDASRKEADAIRKLVQVKVNLPPNPLTGEAPPYDGFPIPKYIETGETAVKKITEQTKGMMDAAINLNARKPLVDNVLPAPTGGAGVALQGFKQAYFQAIENFKKQLNATAPLTQADEERARQKIWDEKYVPRRMTDADGNVVNEKQLKLEFDNEVVTLRETLRARQAIDYTVFLHDEKSLDVHNGIPSENVGDLPTLENVWAAQLSLWIQQDVVDAIVQTNKERGRKNDTGKVNVEGAVVKQILSIEIPKVYKFRGKNVAIGTGSVGGPSAMTPLGAAMGARGGPTDPLDETSPAAALKQDYATSYTGRTSNPLFDVMHFKVQVVADARDFRAFMAYLTKNRFITILNAQVVGWDRAQTLAHDGLSLGPDPVVGLALDCEAVFFRQWTVYNPETKAIGPMPAAVRKTLHIPEVAAQP